MRVLLSPLNFFPYVLIVIFYVALEKFPMSTATVAVEHIPSPHSLPTIHFNLMAVTITRSKPLWQYIACYLLSNIQAMSTY